MARNRSMGSVGTLCVEIINSQWCIRANACARACIAANLEHLAAHSLELHSGKLCMITLLRILPM